MNELKIIYIPIFVDYSSINGFNKCFIWTVYGAFQTLQHDYMAHKTFILEEHGNLVFHDMSFLLLMWCFAWCRAGEDLTGQHWFYFLNVHSLNSLCTLFQRRKFVFLIFHQHNSFLTIPPIQPPVRDTAFHILKIPKG